MTIKRVRQASGKILLNSCAKSVNKRHRSSNSSSRKIKKWAKMTSTSSKMTYSHQLRAISTRRITRHLRKQNSRPWCCILEYRWVPLVFKLKLPGRSLLIARSSKTRRISMVIRKTMRRWAIGEIVIKIMIMLKIMGISLARRLQKT